MAMSSAPILSGTVTDRLHLPARPADVKVEGVGFGTVDLTGLTQADVTWANRNRTTETAVVLTWTDGTVTPETDQESIVRALDDAGNVLAEYSGLTGTSHTLDLTSFGAETSGFIEVAAEKDGFESLQAFRIPVLVDAESPGAITYWRLYITDSVSAGTGDNFKAQINEIEFRSTAGVPETPSGGTAFGSSNVAPGGEYANAFDGNDSTLWSSASGALLPQSIGYQFTSGKSVAEVSILASTDSFRLDRLPKSFEVQYSSDGVNWTTALTVTDEPPWSAGEERTYAL